MSAGLVRSEGSEGESVLHFSPGAPGLMPSLQSPSGLVVFYFVVVDVFRPPCFTRVIN